MRRCWRREEVQESQSPRVPRSRDPKDQDISNSHSNTSLTLKKFHLVIDYVRLDLKMMMVARVVVRMMVVRKVLMRILLFVMRIVVVVMRMVRVVMRMVIRLNDWF